jgi:hypothetical protein
MHDKTVQNNYIRVRAEDMLYTTHFAVSAAYSARRRNGQEEYKMANSFDSVKDPSDICIGIILIFVYPSCHRRRFCPRTRKISKT